MFSEKELREWLGNIREKYWNCVIFSNKCVSAWLQSEMRESHTKCVRVGMSGYGDHHWSWWSVRAKHFKLNTNKIEKVQESFLLAVLKWLFSNCLELLESLGSTLLENQWLGAICYCLRRF